MTHWHDPMVDTPETDGAVYMTGWTISGLAVLGAIVAVWLAPHREATTQTACMEKCTPLRTFEKVSVLLTVLVDAQGIEPWTSPV